MMLVFGTNVSAHNSTLLEFAERSLLVTSGMKDVQDLGVRSLPAVVDKILSCGKATYATCDFVA
jgi:hypothetical protein